MLRVQVEFKFYRWYKGGTFRRQIEHNSIGDIGPLTLSVQWAVGGACPTYCQTSVGSATVAGTRGTRQLGSESDSPRSNLKHCPHVLPDPTCLVLNFEFSFDDGSSPNALFSSVLAYSCVYFRDAGCRDEPMSEPG